MLSFSRYGLRALFQQNGMMAWLCLCTRGRANLSSPKWPIMCRWGVKPYYTILYPRNQCSNYRPMSLLSPWTKKDFPTSCWNESNHCYWLTDDHSSLVSLAAGPRWTQYLRYDSSVLAEIHRAFTKPLTFTHRGIRGHNGSFRLCSVEGHAVVPSTVILLVNWRQLT